MEGLKEISLETTVKAAAWGALMGARGNSGIILSQVLSGLAEVVEGRERLFAEDIVFGFSLAAKKAYKAVLHPTEGTILTVIRETAETAEEVVKTEKDLALLLDGMAKSARSSVERTPLLLPKLKEAGVVDAGGLGFLYFLEGMVQLIQGAMKTDEAIEEEGMFNGTVNNQSITGISDTAPSLFPKEAGSPRTIRTPSPWGIPSWWETAAWQGFIFIPANPKRCCALPPHWARFHRSRWMTCWFSTRPALRT
jgi:dihydroxyacetone kinase-like predicted kinase